MYEKEYSNMNPREFMDNYAFEYGYSNWQDLHGQCADNIDEHIEAILSKLWGIYNIPEDEESWLGAEVECDICTNKWWAVFPIEAEKLECPNCGRMVQHNITA